MLVYIDRKWYIEKQQNPLQAITKNHRPGNQKKRGVAVKSIHLAFVLFCLILPSCSSHFYKMSGREVTLYLDTPAESVEFFCSLNDYAGQTLNQRKGIWEVTVPADKPFRYFYKVDGENFLPICPNKEKDDFGSENCIFEPRL